MKDIDKLRERAVNAAEKVEKQIVLIGKYEKQIEKLKNKAMELGCDPEKTSGDYWGNREQYNVMCDISYKKRDFDSAKKKLVVLKETAEKLQEEVKVLENQMAYLEGACPEVIKTFLEDWKSRCYQYYLQHYEEYLQFKENLAAEELEVRKDVLLNHPVFEEVRNRSYVKEYIIEKNDYSSYNLHNLVHHGEPYKVLEDILKEKRLDWRTKEKRINQFAGQVVLAMEGYHNAEERSQWLDKFLEREKKEKMFDLIERITSITGKITDASYLHIGAKGDINGTIIGEDGMASVETIGAGGYNIQCYHYRTLIHEVQPKQMKKTR